MVDLSLCVCVCVCQVRGLSNLFWGWGREDDELYLRMREAGMTVSRRGAHIGNSSVCCCRY